MAYRDAETPKASKEEEELKKLAEEGRRLKKVVALEARQAEMALERSAKRAEIAQRDTYLRSLGRRGHPLRATMIISLVMLVFTVLGGYFLYQSSLHVAIWVHILIWAVSLPSVLPAIYLERWVAKRQGRLLKSSEQAWADSQRFGMECQLWDHYDGKSAVRLDVYFERGKPEPQVLGDALGVVREDVEVEVVGLLGDEPPNDSKAAMAKAAKAKSKRLERRESLGDMRAQAMLSAPGGGFTLAIRHRRNHYTEYWLEEWTKKAVASAFETVHDAYPIARLHLIK